MRSLLALVALAGCDLYLANASNTNEVDAGCGSGGSGSSGGVLRDPSTGTCQSFADCTINVPQWPKCDGPCEGLSECACLANKLCHAAYTPSSGSGAPVFETCWDVGPDEPSPTAPCAGLDANACADEPTCASLMVVETDVEHFTSCFAAPTSPTGCADPGICYGSVQCNDAPPACPVGTVAGITNGCWSGYCIPTTKCPD